MALRGATTVTTNTEADIMDATHELLAALAARNTLDPNEIISLFFTLTPDLNACFPARAARLRLGWDVPMIDMVEVDVPGALSRCIRVLIHVRRDQPGRHAYLREARALRPELEEPT